MDNFFKTMKIRKVILVYAAVVIFFCIISELSFVKSTGILDENLFLLLCNLGVLVWFMLELRKVGCAWNCLLCYRNSFEHLFC
ncbi:hypothetical protein [Clostridium coskatii]|uniref:Uncharacterized protein n=1 Tax=Clostridium coskatii TaxID=1705578 RepID=A0A162L277_9CLOT|nr:hypothetical protein [Clostridium coskatii]OAA90122.1 hypothetical protein WX73_02210 [Clostridium coskatii]OBR92764.1 hypothetical protein CLCOS_28260 [Clostridium coskatii]